MKEHSVRSYQLAVSAQLYHSKSHFSQKSHVEQQFLKPVASLVGRKQTGHLSLSFFVQMATAGGYFPGSGPFEFLV